MVIGETSPPLSCPSPCHALQDCQACLEGGGADAGDEGCVWSVNLGRCLSPVIKPMLCLGGICGKVNLFLFFSLSSLNFNSQDPIIFMLIRDPSCKNGSGILPIRNGFGILPIRNGSGILPIRNGSIFAARCHRPVKLKTINYVRLNTKITISKIYSVRLQKLPNLKMCSKNLVPFFTFLLLLQNIFVQKLD